MSRTVSELNISDQYAVIDVSTRVNQAVDLMMKPSVEVLLVKDPDIDRIVGVLTENQILKILASGADASRTKVATHMLPNKKSVRGILRLTPDAPLEEAKKYILEQNPIAVIVESISPSNRDVSRASKVNRDTKSPTSLVGFVSPSDIRSLVSIQEETIVKAESRSTISTNDALFQPEIRTPDSMRHLLGKEVAKSVDNLSVDVANQIIQISTHYIAEHGPMKQPGSQRPNGRDWLVCSSSNSGGVTAVWPISSGDVAVHGKDVPLYVCAWMSSPSTNPPDSWKKGVVDSLSARPAPKATAVIVDVMNDRRPRLDSIVSVALGIGKDVASGSSVMVDLSKIKEFDATRHRILVCAHS